MFNLGAGEVVVLLLFAVIFLGPRKLSELAPRLRGPTATPLVPRWSWSDWLLTCAALLTGAVALLLSAGIAR
ncbi:MAG TPA: hypothetical protein VIF57_29865 [Polyangia bacterium]